eukprot:4155816-Pleurochrysis_carterae.AAC.1
MLAERSKQSKRIQTRRGGDQMHAKAADLASRSPLNSKARRQAGHAEISRSADSDVCVRK